MKVGFENGVATYSGKYLEIVYQNWFDNRLCYARKYTYPTLSSQNQEIREIGQNLNKVYTEANAAYIADFKAYAEKNSRENRSKTKKFLHKMPSSKSLFVQCMWAWYHSDPEHVNLKTVTIADIVTLDSDVRTVKRCVEAGWLKKVTQYETYNHDIQTGI